MSSILTTWYGHCHFTFEDFNYRLAIDPFITNNPMFPLNCRYPSPNFILVSSLHPDHLGDTIQLARLTHAYIITSYEIATHLYPYLSTNQVVGLNVGSHLDLGKGWKLRLVKTDPLLTIGPLSSNFYPNVGFMIQFPSGVRMYYSGTTHSFAEMEQIDDLYAPKYGFLPIDDTYTMNPYETAYALSRYLRSITNVIPMHWGFPQSRGTPQDLIYYLNEFRHMINVYVAIPGQSFYLN